MKNKILITASVFLFTGCMSVEKAEKVMRANPTELAKLCHDCFPVKESEVIKGDVIYLPSDTVYTESVDTVTVTADCPDGTQIKKKCPQCVNKTVYIPTLRVDTVKLLDSAYTYELEQSIKEKDKSIDKWRSTALWGWGILGVLLLIVFIRKRLP